MIGSPAPWIPDAGPDADACALPRLIDARAASRPDAVFALFEDGATWTWRQTRARTRETADALRSLGVEPGGIVAAWAPNSEALLAAWFGANYAGAALAPINTAFRGRLLEHAIAKTSAKVLIVHPALAPRLEGLALGDVRTVILTGPSPAPLSLDAEVLGPEALNGDGGRAEPYDAQPWHTPVIIFTSGTTGPSKAVETAYAQEWATATCTYGYMTEADRILVNLPMFHVGGISAIFAAVLSGGSMALFEAFDTRRFWETVRATGSTTCSGFIGALTTFLRKEPTRSDDADNPLRICTLAPISEDTIAISERFGFDYFSGFNMTEVACPLVTEVNDRAIGSCGRARPGIECRIVDENDYPLPDGAVGELVIRSRDPWQLFKGYLGDPDATARAWRNGWFHTGDLLRRDAQGRHFFVDRKKDAIRRRGENISSVEIETEVSSYPAVQEVAAYGVESPDGEQEVMVCVSPRAGQDLDPRSLAEFLIPRMAHFMVPRYVRIEPELPKTPTNKIRKSDLRAEGVTNATWDREAAGLRLRRERLGPG